MKVLTLGQYHDFNACLYDTETGWFKYIKDERISGIKHSGKFHSIVDVIKKEKFAYEHIVFCFGDFFGDDLYDDNVTHYRTKLSECHETLKKYSAAMLDQAKKDKIRRTTRDTFAKESFRTARFKHHLTIIDKIVKLTRDVPGIDHTKITAEWVQHHYAHSLSGWIIDREKNKFVQTDYAIAVDGRSFDSTTIQIVKNPFKIKKIRNKIARKIYTTKLYRYNKDKGRFFLQGNSFGGSWNPIGRMFGFKGLKLDFAGKLMGLNAYGEVNQEQVDCYKDYEWNLKNINSIYKKIKKGIARKNYTKRPVYPKIRNSVATFNKIWSDSIVYLFEKYIPKDAKVIFSGGCAQNTLLNFRLKKMYPNLTVVPHCYDGGLSLGSLGYYLRKHELNFKAGDACKFPYIQSDIAPDTEPSKRTIKRVAKMLSNGKIVGWYQGHGECGPRALGNRSILMDPSIKQGKNKINQKIKHREYWRPFAPSVLEEEASNWFDLDESKFMMYAANVLENKRGIIPAVTHEDNTSRIQTLTREDNAHFYDLIHEFFNLTKIPMLLNTSLNGNREPIFGSPEEALKFFEKSNLDAICIGNKIYTK